MCRRGDSCKASATPSGQPSAQLSVALLVSGETRETARVGGWVSGARRCVKYTHAALRNTTFRLVSWVLPSSQFVMAGEDRSTARVNYVVSDYTVTGSALVLVVAVAFVLRARGVARQERHHEGFLTLKKSEKVHHYERCDSMKKVNLLRTCTTGQLSEP